MTEGASVPSGSARGPDLQVSYGPHADQVADVYLPRAPVGSPTLVLALHGGFWRQGYDRVHLAPLVRALALAGDVVVSVEYRRVGGAGGWPATFDDVAAACDSLPDLVAGASPVALSTGPRGAPRCVLVGHSAGGHLALWAAASCPPLGLAAVVGLAPVADLVAAQRLGLGAGAVDLLMGGPPELVPDRFATCDPATLPSPGVPTTLVHGTADLDVPVGLSRGYAERHGARLVELDCGHFELIDPTCTSEFDAVSRAVAAGR
ncbi:MAG: alpha/beta hydrolase [Actinomycetes bacterium]